MTTKRTKPRRKGMNIAATAGRRREAHAVLDEQTAQILCPFCFPRHQINVAEPGKCGTILELKAVQRLYVGVTCLKCGDSTGTLVRAGVGYEHSHDCSPGKVFLEERPVPSVSARLAIRMPARLRGWLERRRGAVATKLSAPDGSVVYSWMKV